jgi:exodeoxyribonuclease-3
MRLVAWNCAMGLSRKLEELRKLRPDMAVLSEVACSKRLRKSRPELHELPIIWVGDKNPNKGLAVISFTGSELALDASYRKTNKFVAPVRVNGPKRFNLLAVWDYNDRQEGLNKRPGPLLRALEQSSDFCKERDLVVAGDFNNNRQWDKPNGLNNMVRIARELMDRGLVSLYHEQTKLPFGSEAQFTYWHWRRRDRPYHIDYIFVPKTWLKNKISFEIGTFEPWCLTRRSDHAPLIAEFR